MTAQNETAAPVTRGDGQIKQLPLPGYQPPMPVSMPLPGLPEQVTMGQARQIVLDTLGLVERVQAMPNEPPAFDQYRLRDFVADVVSVLSGSAGREAVS